LSLSLLKKGYKVFGTSRNSCNGVYPNLDALGIRNSVVLIPVELGSFEQVRRAIEYSKACEIYYLAGQSSVAQSFDQPGEALLSINLGLINILEAIKISGLNCRIFNASSGECFGDANGELVNENSILSPMSPYAIAKIAAQSMCEVYRSSYGTFACSGIMFNHESPLRPERFVTQKIIQTGIRIAQGSKEILELGDLSIVRDWGWAEEYVEAIWLMMQQDKPQDFVIASGRSLSLQEFVAVTFGHLGLDWSCHVKVNESFFRPNEIKSVRADPSKAKCELGWEAKIHSDGLIAKMLASGKEY
jgi:GDPmannose 4,6-dehydratase